MKHITIVIIAAIAFMTLNAATPRKQIIGNFDRSASNHYAYPFGTDVDIPELTPAPAGYEPFHIDHYGRHGSRWLTNGRTYERPLNQLKKAKEAGMLNLQGDLLLRQLSLINETSKQRGHQYVTIAIDALQRRVIDVEDGRTKEAVTAVKARLERQGGSADNITAVTSDMSASYLPAVKECFPHAEQVIDKFHVKQVLTKALDEVRKNEQREVDDKKTLFQYRKLFMMRDDHMSEKQQYRYKTLSKTYPKTARAHRIVEALDTFYACTTMADATKHFKELYSWIRRCRLQPMKDVAVTLMKHRNEIMNYFHDRLTNAICEGFNSLVQAAKRKARGFNTFDGFRAMIFLVGGKLVLDVPSLF